MLDYTLLVGLFLIVEYRLKWQQNVWEWIKVHIVTFVFLGLTGMVLSLLLFQTEVRTSMDHESILILAASLFIVFVMFEHLLAPDHSSEEDDKSALSVVPPMELYSPRRENIEEALLTALERKQFTLYYQAQYDAATRQILGFEALLRWEHPELGTVSPAEFIPVAESSGLIVGIGEWVLREACRKNKELQAGGFTGSVMSVNISALQLRNVQFAYSVRSILRDTRLEGKYLEVELTESALIQSLDTSASILNELRDMGVRIALDDFGTGYSSLSYLKQLPIHNVKIDRSFVQNLCNEPKGKVIVESIVAMVHKLGLGVVAEGIETEEQLDCVRSIGCESVQGYLLGKPLPGADLRYVIPSLRSGTGTI